MKTATIPAVSNLATWRQLVEVTDADDGSLVDLETDVDAISVKVRDLESDTEVLTATLAAGTVAVTATGVFEFLFTADQMADITPKTYELGCLIEIDGDTTQLILGRVPVLKGL